MNERGCPRACSNGACSLGDPAFAARMQRERRVKNLLEELLGITVNRSDLRDRAANCLMGASKRALSLTEIVDLARVAEIDVQFHKYLD
jgi:hypothetical protein